MRHHLYLMFSTAPAPAGDGDTASWFWYYKWPGDEEAYVPRRSPFIKADPGDYLWFVLDQKVLGAVPIDRVETPSLPTMRQELWYDQKKIVELPPDLYETAPLGAESVEESVGARWLTMTRERP